MKLEEIYHLAKKNNFHLFCKKFELTEEIETCAIDFIEFISKRFNIQISQIKSKSRKRPLVEARQICMKYMCEELNVIPTSAGFYFNRDRTTVSYAIKCIDDVPTLNKKYNDTIEKYKKETSKS